MLSIAICDDNPIVCSQIERIILDYGKKFSYEIAVEVYWAGEELFRCLEDGIYYDMIFLDIVLKAQNGIEIGIKIREELKNETVLIIYISGNDSYALDLFKVRPMNFLIKPIVDERITYILEKGMELLNCLSQTFEYKQGRNNKKIEVKSIIYFESMNRKVKMVTTIGEEIFYASLSDIFLDLEKYAFFFCHKAYLVNYHQITKFKYEELLMSNGEILPIGRKKRICIRDMQSKMHL